MLEFDLLPDRIKRKIRFSETGCWEWTAATSSAGYGRVGWEGSTRESHRVVYTLLAGPIPDRMVIDHMCHDPAVCKKVDRECPHRRCQNPAHFAIVTRASNALRSCSPPALNALSDRCDQGHPYVYGSFTETEGHRRCLTCRRETDKRRRPRGVPRKDRERKGVREFIPWGETAEKRTRDAEIIRLREGGVTFNALAAELGISASFASAQYNRLRGAQGVAARKSLASNDRRMRAQEMTRAGRSVPQIAAALGASRATIYRDLRT